MPNNQDLKDKVVELIGKLPQILEMTVAGYFVGAKIEYEPRRRLIEKYGEMRISDFLARAARKMADHSDPTFEEEEFAKLCDIDMEPINCLDTLMNLYAAVSE